MITAEQRDELIEESACCLVTLNIALIESEQNGESIDCSEGEVLMLAESIDVLSRYIPAGTVISVTTTTDARATINLTDLILTDGMSGIITVNINGVVIVLATFSGDFASFTLSQFIDMLIAALVTGGTGFTGTNSSPSIIITAPTTLGILPLGSVISISVAPTYYLRHERTTPLVTGFATGSGNPLGIGFPAFVNNQASNAYGYLYVTNSNRLYQVATVDYTGAIVGNTRTFPCVPGINATVLAIGNTIELRSATNQITGTIIAPGYNAGTGVLTFQITALAAVPGNESWTLNSLNPCYGSINVFEWNNATEQLDFLQTIYTPLAIPTSCFYDSDSDAVYATCSGIDNTGLGSGLIKIDCSSPFVVSAFVGTAPLSSASLLMDNPVTENIYFIANSFNIFAKVDKLLNYNTASNITTAYVDPVLFPPLYYARAFAKTVNPSSGVIYYSVYFGDTDYVDRVIQLNPVQGSLAIRDTASTFFIFNDSTNPPNAGVYDMFYHEPTQRLYVARYLGARYLFQSYDISSGVPATILNTRIDHATPNVPLSVTGLFNSIINYQPLHNRMLLMSDSVVFIYNPSTMLFEGSYVIQPNFAENFSRTDDIINNNFYGTAGTGYISVISQEEDSIDFEGEFEGEVITTEVVQEAGTMCDINPNIAISNIKKACGCCDEAGSTFTCDNLTGTQSGGAVVCSQIVTTDGWTADGAAFCNLAESDLPYEVEYTSCFSATTFYKLTVIVTNYTAGFSSVEFQGNFIANVMGNGTTAYYLSATAGAGTLSFSPVGWSGCIQYTLETYLPGWENEGGWEIDQTTGCFVHHAGVAVGELHIDNNIIAGKTYQVKVSRGVVGTLNLVIGGETHTYTDSGVDTFTFTATVSGECYFTTTLESEVQICLLQTCTITEGNNPEETSLILGAGTPTTYIDANGNPVLIT